MVKRIDPGHVRTIARFTLAQELRSKRSSSKKPSHRTLVSLLVMYVFAGFACGWFLSRLENPFSESFIASTFFMILTVNFIVMEFPTLVTGPEDYAYYVQFPVTPASYFLGKAVALCAIVLSLGIAFTVPVVMVHVLVAGADPWLPLLVLSILLSGMTAVFIFIDLLGILVRFVSLKYVRTVSSTLQFLIIFALYGLVFVFSRNTGQYSSSLSFGWNPWLILVPSAWLPAVFELARGPSAIAAFALAFVSIPAFAAIASRVISFEFGCRITEIESRATVRKSGGKTKFSFLFRTHEEKAVSLLLKNHFKYDQQFRMAILTIIPISVIYFILVFVNSASGIRDPFTPEGIGLFATTIPIYVAIGFFPFYIKNALSYSSSAEASWIFYVAAYERIKLIDAAWKFVFVFFLVPYFAVVILAYMLITKSVIGILLHFLVVFLLSLAQTDVFLYFFAELPFSRKYQKGKGMLSLYLRMLAAPLLPVPLVFFVYFLYGDPVSFTVLVVSLVALAVVVRIFGRKRAVKRLEREEYGYGA